MEKQSLIVSLNPNFSSFELSRPVSPVTRSLVPFRSAKLVPRSISRVSASISTPSSDTDKISVKPVYVPTPPNRELRTPHSGYHFDGTARKFFEGWYFRVSIPDKRESFCFMYSVENPAFRQKLSPLDVALYGPRFTGVGAQILGANEKYLCQYTQESHNFWGDRDELAITAKDTDDARHKANQPTLKEPWMSDMNRNFTRRRLSIKGFSL